MSDPKYCIVGDLHGRSSTLDRIISSSPGYKFILLGDTIHHKSFFRRPKKTSSAEMLFKIKEMHSAGRAELILGNHESYILDNLILPGSKIKNKEIRNSLRSLKHLEAEKRFELLSWLSTRPLTLEFESEGKLYKCAHAYYNPNYNHPASGPDARHRVLHGLHYNWFKKDRLEDHIKSHSEYFLGHYGYPYFRKNLHIIDATNFDGVGVYYTDREEFTIFY